MDLFPLNVGTAGPPPNAPPQIVTTKGLTMGYYDGNTVTALWNYAQQFAMSDNSYGTVFGPSTPGLINLVSGQTNGVTSTLNGTGGNETDGGNGTLTVIGDPDPVGDVCSAPTRGQVQMCGQEHWRSAERRRRHLGRVHGRLRPDGRRMPTAPPAACAARLRYSREPPQTIFLTTLSSSTTPAPPIPRTRGRVQSQRSGAMDAANHQYDINDFFKAVKKGDFPAVSFLKAQAYQDGHAGYSDPLDEQTFVVNVINAVQKSPDWDDTAVVIAYDDSDGWYDHQMGPIVNQSTSPADTLTGTGACGDGSTALPGADSGNLHAQGRCGYGPRLPCWSSLHGRGKTSWTTPSPTKPRSCGSSKTTG